MRTTLITCSICVLCLMLALLITPCAFAQEDQRSTVEQQKSVAVTIYNSGVGLVRDTRAIDLPQADSLRLQFMDVAAKIMPDSVHIVSLTAPNGLLVLEQNYEYDLLNPAKLMEKYVGKQVKLIQKNAFTNTQETKTGTLLSTNEGRIYKFNDEIYINPEGQVVLPDIPKNLIAKPTLVWLLQNKQKGAQTVEATYLTEGISWEATYVLLLPVDEKGKASIDAWVTIKNQSGAGYNNALLKLVAGDIHRIQPPRAPRQMAMARGGMMDMAQAAPQFEERQFFEYHLYELLRPATVLDNQTKQILFHETDKVGVERLYRYRAQQSNWWFQRMIEPISNERPTVFVKFMNTEENGLGIPLPAGLVRVYMEDKDKTAQFTGEDRIKHTPKNEKVELEVGKAFDVVIERKQTDFQRISNNVYETAWELKIRSHKDKPIEIEVLEDVQGDWEVLSSSIKFEKYTSNVLKFVAPLEPEKEYVLTYRVRIRQ